MSTELLVSWSRKPSRGTSLLLSFVLVVTWSILALLTFPGVVLPLSYGLPLLVCVWTRDRAALVGMTAILAVLLTVEIFWALPLDALSSSARWASYAAASTSLAITAVAVYLIIALNRSLEASLRTAHEAAERLRCQTAELHASEARLRVADRRKAEFLATLSHELRSPLAAMRYALSVVMSHEGAAGHALSVIERQLQHLVRLVDDLLDIQRIDSNRFELRIQRVELATIIRQAVDFVMPDVRRAGHDLVVSLPSSPMLLDADPERLAQVITNLLGNATRYTPEGGHIELSVAAADGMAVISIRDDGIGIRREDLGRIFEMFTQLGAPGQGGLGIGLALVKSIVERHGGHVTAHSEGKGHGSRFDVHLSLASTTESVPPPAVIIPGPGARRRILVVDDNVDVADMLKVMLELDGHRVEVAHDGRTAQALAETFVPEIALLDIGLPDIDGYELATRLHQAPATRHTHLIAVTGWGQAEDRTRAQEHGFAAHLTKPAARIDVLRLVAAAPRVSDVTGGMV